MHARGPMRVLFAVLLGVPLSAKAADVRIEVAAGAGGAFDSSVLAPVLSVRAGMDFWEFFEPGLRITGVLGPEGVDLIPGGQGGNGAGSVLGPCPALPRFLIQCGCRRCFLLGIETDAWI